MATPSTLIRWSLKVLMNNEYRLGFRIITPLFKLYITSALIVQSHGDRGVSALTTNAIVVSNKKILKNLKIYNKMKSGVLILKVLLSIDYYYMERLLLYGRTAPLWFSLTLLLNLLEDWLAL